MPVGSPLRHDLVLYGLPAVDARRLRDALARAQVVVDVTADDDVVRIPAVGNRAVAAERILAVVRDWAARRRLARVPVAYGGRLYTLTVACRQGQRGPRQPARSPRSITVDRGAAPDELPAAPAAR